MKVLALMLVLIAVSLPAQNSFTSLDSLFLKVFSSELNELPARKLTRHNKSVIVVGGINCSACVKYFNGTKKINFLFIINGESLSEINRIKKVYELNGSNCYFVTKNYIKQKSRVWITSFSPILLKKEKNGVILYSYSQLDSLSQEFNDSNYRFL